MLSVMSWASAPRRQNAPQHARSAMAGFKRRTKMYALQRATQKTARRAQHVHRRLFICTKCRAFSIGRPPRNTMFTLMARIRDCNVRQRTMRWSIEATWRVVRAQLEVRCFKKHTARKALPYQMPFRVLREDAAGGGRNGQCRHAQR